MLLSELILAVLALAAVAFVALRAVAPFHATGDREGTWVVDRLGAGLLALTVILIAFRNRSFGFDTEAYVEVFNSYCHGDSLDYMEGGFRFSAFLLNGAMLGACRVGLLPAAWVFLVVSGVLIARGEAAEKGRYAALLLLSLVGIELTTNALRQGIAAGLSIAAVSHWERRRLTALACAAAGMALHASVALVLLGIVASMLPWSKFLAVLGAGCALVVLALEYEPAFVANVAPIQRLLYEIQKYQGHEGDEIWVRVLSYCSVLVTLAAPVLAGRDWDERSRLLMNPRFIGAVRLTASCLPFLLVPYFGYRYVYGVFPVVLWITTSMTKDAPELSARTFSWTLPLNASVVLAWSLGSSYMRSVPFFG